MCKEFFFRSKKIRGFTLTEMAIVLGVASAVIGAIWGVAGSVKSQRNNVDAVNELQAIKQSIFDMRAGQPFTVTPGTDITSTLITAGVIPSLYTSSPTAATTPWGTSLTVKATADRTFHISFLKVPSLSSCINLVLQGTNCDAAQNGCPTEVYVAGGEISQIPAVGVPNGWQQVLTPALAKTFCGNNTYIGSTITNDTVEFDYAL
jgi:type II secretory pathway pseudopilin PulG